jgi:hypothetical protein
MVVRAVLPQSLATNASIRPFRDHAVRWSVVGDRSRSSWGGRTVGGVDSRLSVIDDAMRELAQA